MIKNALLTLQYHLLHMLARNNFAAAKRTANAGDLRGHIRALTRGVRAVEAVERLRARFEEEVLQLDFASCDSRRRSAMAA